MKQITKVLTFVKKIIKLFLDKWPILPLRMCVPLDMKHKNKWENMKNMYSACFFAALFEFLYKEKKETNVKKYKKHLDNQNNIC